MSTKAGVQSAITAALQNAVKIKSLCGKEPFKKYRENTDRWQAIKKKKDY